MKKDKKRKFLIPLIILLVIIGIALSIIKYINDHRIIYTYMTIDGPLNYSYSVTKNGPSDNEEWTTIANHNKTLENSVEDNVYIKDENNHISFLGKTDSNSIKILTNKKTIYLIKDETYQLDFIYYSISDNENDVFKPQCISDNSDIASVSDDGLIKATGNGNTIVHIKYNEQDFMFNVYSTTLLVTVPKTYDFEKEYVGCNAYSKDENDLIDTYLKEKVDEKGYATRAGAVEAMRFLTLNFPYRINYYFENGRLAYGVDGEGRYYHKGLYLSDSRYSSLNKDMIAYGPGTWGCPIYQFEIEDKRNNGLDCSGLVTWAIYNGGFDVKDIGAGGFGNSAFSLSDIGEIKDNSLELIKNIKAGDLVHNDENGGHIGMVIGIDDKHVYVAQALWYKTVGCIVSEYTYEDFVKHWIQVVLMDTYYIKDGNYSPMW